MAAFLLILIVCLCAGCGEQQVKKSELILDTAVTLTAEGADAQAAIDESMARLKNIDSMVNPNVPDSDVNKLAPQIRVAAKTQFNNFLLISSLFMFLIYFQLQRYKKK